MARGAGGANQQFIRSSRRDVPVAFDRLPKLRRLPRVVRRNREPPSFPRAAAAAGARGARKSTKGRIFRCPATPPEIRGPVWPDKRIDFACGDGANPSEAPSARTDASASVIPGYLLTSRDYFIVENVIRVRLLA